ncbi:glycosyltransferase [Nitratidesulfovibrio sp.]|uniref:glycosyltransferase n=1 Tax=Nitratidesulfovibrio sp. TaxID=2802297 RepID=UPI003340C85C
MMHGKDFIVFSDDWGRHPFSCQHILRHFMPGNRVLWVNTIGMRLPRLSLYDARRAVEKLYAWMGPSPGETRPLPEGLRVIAPVMLPFAPLAPVREFNRRSVVGDVRRAAAAWGLRDPILLATLPNAADYVGRCGESLVVYYCVDEFAVWPGMNLPEMVRSLEADLLRSADLVVGVSDALVARKGNGRSPTHLLTHGVDFAHFRTAYDSQPVPPFLADLTGPVIGFYGLIDTHLDVELLAGLLDARPDWTVVLIGVKRIPLDALERRPNFRWLPAVPYADLPRHAARFDAAIIPYRVNEHTCTANPLKLREYMATGKPVVTTPMTEVLRFRDVIHVASTVGGFVEAIAAELAAPTPPDARWAVLAGETWEDKAQALSGWMEATLAERLAARREVA